MHKRQVLLLLAISILLLACMCPITNFATQIMENWRDDEPIEVIVQVASETPATELTPTHAIELTPTTALEPTPAEVLMVDTQDTFMFRGNLEHTGVYLSPGPKDSPSLAWQFKAEDSIYSPPAVYEGVVFFWEP